VCSVTTILDSKSRGALSQIGLVDQAQDKVHDQPCPFIQKSPSIACKPIQLVVQREAGMLPSCIGKSPKEPFSAVPAPLPYLSYTLPRPDKQCACCRAIVIVNTAALICYVCSQTVTGTQSFLKRTFECSQQLRACCSWSASGVGSIRAAL
jgi:hypothetical protein